MQTTGSVLGRLRGLLSDPNAAIWSDSELKDLMAGNLQVFKRVSLERMGSNLYVFSDKRWAFAEGYTPTLRIDGEVKTPDQIDLVKREATLTEEVPEETCVTLDFVGVNLYNTAADAKLSAAGDPTRQQAIIAQGMIHLSNKTPADQLREDAKAFRVLGLPSAVEIEIPSARGV